MDTQAHGDRAYQLFSTTLVSQFASRHSSDNQSLASGAPAAPRGSVVVNLGSLPGAEATAVRRASRARSVSEAVVPLPRVVDQHQPQSGSIRDLSSNAAAKSPPKGIIKPNHVETPPTPRANIVSTLPPIAETLPQSSSDVIASTPRRRSLTGARLPAVPDGSETETDIQPVVLPMSLNRRRSDGLVPPFSQHAARSVVIATGAATVPRSPLRQDAPIDVDAPHKPEVPSTQFSDLI